MFFRDADVIDYIHGRANVPPVESADVRLVPAAEVARRLGVHVRTLKRRVFEAQAALADDRAA